MENIKKAAILLGRQVKCHQEDGTLLFEMKSSVGIVSFSWNFAGEYPSEEDVIASMRATCAEMRQDIYNTFLKIVFVKSTNTVEEELELCRKQRAAQVAAFEANRNLFFVVLAEVQQKGFLPTRINLSTKTGLELKLGWFPTPTLRFMVDHRGEILGGSCKYTYERWINSPALADFIARLRAINTPIIVDSTI